ncbi:uncharacterized protein [Dermacentor andersoni]|uniref:uncharacterized protein n=1 Tax=Dermacentor andersoni TaxID=34620 RepID=UPI0024173811|nr:uncharacterized protein LOC129383838 [Dermacentor andersoni]
MQQHTVLPSRRRLMRRVLQQGASGRDMLRHLATPPGSPRMARVNLFQEISAFSDHFSKGVLVVTYLLAVCIAGNFIGAGIRDQVISRSSSVRTYQGFLDEDSVSPFAKISCLCLLPTFKEAGRKEKSKLQIPHLRRGVRCKRLVHALMSRLPRGRTPRSPKTAFLRRAFCVLWIDVLRTLLTTAAYYFCIYARVPALE